MSGNKIWMSNVNLAWELFSAGICNYRLCLIEPKVQEMW